MTSPIKRARERLDTILDACVRARAASHEAALSHVDNIAFLARMARSALEDLPSGRAEVAHDGFKGDVIGFYETREGKRGAVVQQDGTRVVHVYSERFLTVEVEAAPVQTVDAAEARARRIYDSWTSRPGWVPWVQGGNSDMQAEARRMALREQTADAAVPDPLAQATARRYARYGAMALHAFADGLHVDNLLQHTAGDARAIASGNRRISAYAVEILTKLASSAEFALNHRDKNTARAIARADADFFSRWVEVDAKQHH